MYVGESLRKTTPVAGLTIKTHKNPCPSRFRPTQTKTKKTKTETKLEFFGFEDKEDQEDEEGAEGGMAGKSSYKIKYFGFDDLSESDSDDESSQAKEKKAKKADAALAALSSSVDSPHTSDSQDSQASSNTGELAFCILDWKQIWWLNEVLNGCFKLGEIERRVVTAQSVYILVVPIIWLFQQMLLTFVMTPVPVSLRDRKDAQGSQVKNPRTLVVDLKRSSVDPKRYMSMLEIVCISLYFFLFILLKGIFVLCYASDTLSNCLVRLLVLYLHKLWNWTGSSLLTLVACCWFKRSLQSIWTGQGALYNLPLWPFSQLVLNWHCLPLGRHLFYSYWCLMTVM